MGKNYRSMDVAKYNGGNNMKFCPKCKSIMMPKKKQYVCGCGHKEEAEAVIITEAASERKEVVVVENEISVNVIIDAECSKCGNWKAEYWEIQTRSADEPATRFHKCTKCGHVWREYK